LKDRIAQEIVMSAHTQALLIQAVAFFLANMIMDGGRILHGVVVSCLLFWVSFFLLVLWHRSHVSRFDLLFLRWSSLPFVLVGTPILAPLVESTLNRIMRPAE
jgi:hypothetical protein